MISLSGKFRYFLCTDNVTLRFRHRGLREYIKGKLHRDPCNILMSTKRLKPMVKSCMNQCGLVRII